jgi:membrane-bound serine protease (ClpP class)
MAAHVAAMAPGTSIGAAHPVGGQGSGHPGVMGKKVESFTASFSESIARQRGRNVEWATKAVRESASLPADEAARIKVVDFVARDLDEVVKRSKGRSVDIAGSTQVLDLTPVLDPQGHARVVDYPMRFAERVLNVLADPNVAYILMTAGLLGLYVEFTHPGTVLPGIAGTICLLLALTALQVLSVNYGGLALLIVGVALLVAEAFLPTFGVLGIGGLVAFVLGSLFLFDAERTGLEVARGLVAVPPARSRWWGSWWGRSSGDRSGVGRPGPRGHAGSVGVARQRLDPQGTVLDPCAYGPASSYTALPPGTPFEITGIEGLRLRVRPVAARRS